ncbi:arylesterase [Solemya velum gill symbiont]|uniref:Arylesterase n=2 Tax=Solemya velum gill symbiont TaxID=2340 RepID=A0A1T2DRG6_SOVGS|nr:arylesterase [Solemya velum gill symbiont]OOY33915.1 arylesterase [Solemya velum gill symbiont]OOY36569.1 arylesterase [Solemya velum gill symbiont]OOY45697.1 arylesterase [Solemya velum gill symbiont]OOY49680.1 arylesterase [Solemya velum gill symbiont]
MNQIKRLALVLFLLALFTACSSPELNSIGHDGTILAFGDSLTVGKGADKKNSYPSVLAELSGLTVINAGVSGETTDGGVKRLPSELDHHSPDLLLLIEGGNDILRNRDQASIKANLGAMIQAAKRRGVQVVLFGIPKKSLFSESVPLYQELADEHQLVFDESLVVDLLHTPSLKADQIHLNKVGYRKMAESIYELLREKGAVY